LPLPEDYPAGFDLEDPTYGMLPVRHAAYRGFVFATLSANAPGLEAHLGQAKIGFDETCDRAPDGAVEFVGGCHRYVYGGNWKHQMENLADTYHPIACHESTVKKDGYQFQRRTGDEGGQARFFDQGGKPLVPLLGVWSFVNGHNSEASLPFQDEQTGAAFQRYRALLVARHGEARTREILKPKRHNLSLYPTMDIIVLQNAVRVIRPLAVDRTEVRVYPMRLKGAPKEIFTDHIRFLNQTHSASSFIQSDDVESFRRCQEGLMAEGPEWSVVARGVGHETSERPGIRFGERSSEIGQRNQHAAWLKYMTGVEASWARA
jgi:phenylpropionate dioxygenase-like ring-hydroxylating dioxygenase large terminal subunit